MNKLKNKELHRFINKQRGNLYKYHRKTKTNMNQKEVAEKTGVDINTIASYECGRTEPTIDMLIKLSDLYDLTIDELVGKTTRRDNYKQHEIKETLSADEYFEIMKNNYNQFLKNTKRIKETKK